MDRKTRLPLEIPQENVGPLIDALVAEPAGDAATERPALEVRVEATPGGGARPVAKPAAAAPEERRAQMLQPYLASVLPQSENDQVVAVPEQIDVLGYELQLEPWERRLLEQATADDDEELPGWGRHVIEALAFEAMASSSLQRLKAGSSPDPGELNQLRTDLETAVCVGFALQEELQRDLNRLVVKGDVGEAKRLTNLRNKIVHDVAAIKERISADAFERAQNDSAQLVAQFVHPTRKRKSLFAKYKAQPRRSTALRTYKPGKSAESAESARPAERDHRTKHMLMLLVVIIVAWTVLILPQFNKTRTPALDPSIFSHIETIRTVTARPPSLFVHVGTERWASLPESERLALIDTLAGVAEAAGYTSIRVSTTEGLTVGLWLKQTGSRLLDSEREAS